MYGKVDRSMALRVNRWWVDGKIGGWIEQMNE